MALIIDAIQDLPPSAVKPVLTMAMSCRRAYAALEDPGDSSGLAPNACQIVAAYNAAPPKTQQLVYALLTAANTARTTDQTTHTNDGIIHLSAYRRRGGE